MTGQRTKKKLCQSSTPTLLHLSRGLTQALSSTAIHEGSIASPLLSQKAAEAIKARTAISEANSDT